MHNPIRVLGCIGYDSCNVLCLICLKSRVTSSRVITGEVDLLDRWALRLGDGLAVSLSSPEIWMMGTVNGGFVTHRSLDSAGVLTHSTAVVSCEATLKSPLLLLFPPLTMSMAFFSVFFTWINHIISFISLIYTIFIDNSLETMIDSVFSRFHWN